jgi:hypothetical protein
MSNHPIAEQLNHRPEAAASNHAEGNGVCLVVVDTRSAYWERCIVGPTILRALDHFGMPYRLFDLAVGPLTAETVADCAVVLLGENGVGQSLSNAEAQTLADAVTAGIGLVNFDFDLRRCPMPLLEVFGFDRVEADVYATDQLRIGIEPHWITAMQEPNECHQLDHMVSAARVRRWPRSTQVLARAVLGKDQLIYSRHLAPGAALEPGDPPVLFATARGQGRAVQFTVNVRMWLNAVYGHGRALDDLFWRAIVWSARKPFAANMIRPFVCLSMDDCDGRTDFEYARIAAELGFVPLLAMHIRNVPKDSLPTIRELIHTGKALCNTHALDYYELLTYNFGRGECSRDELDRRFGEHDAFWNEVGAPPSRTYRGHWGENGVRAAPYLRDRGMMLWNAPLAMGLLKIDHGTGQGYGPYGRMDRMYDWLPDDPEFLAFSSFPPRGQEDFLVGCFPIQGRAAASDAEKAARVGAEVLTAGLRAGFFGDLCTHEASFDVVSLDEWQRVLRRVVELMQRKEMTFANHDQIGHYLRAKLGTRIAGVHLEGGSLRVRLVGQAATPLSLSVFRNEQAGVRTEYRTVEPFESEGHWEERP